jgi:serine/threonine-protein kinase
VILYEIMAGAHPFDISKSATREAESIVLRGEAERPSVVYFRNRARLGYDSAPSKAAWRDVDAICTKAMDKDIQNRYRSVEALIRDLDHFAKREPLDARTPTLGYRIGKFALRHARVIAISGCAFCLAALVVIFLLLRLEKSRRAENAEAAQTSRIESFMLRLFEGNDKDAGPAADLRVLAILDRGEAEARSLNSEPAVQATFYLTLGNIYGKLGQFDRAERLLTASLKARQVLYGADHEKVADVLISFAQMRLQQSRNQEAEDLVRRALQMHLRHLRKSDPAIARDMTYLGQALDQSGDLQESLSVLNSALELQSAKGTPAADIADTLNVLGDVNIRLSNIKAALDEEERARVLHTRVYGEIHPLVAEDLNNMAVAYESVGNRAPAERLYRRALFVTQSWYGVENPKVSILMASSAQNLLYEGKYEEASRLLNSALAIRRKLFPESDPYIAYILGIMGKVSLREGKLDEAHATFEGVLARYRAAYKEKHPLVGITIGNLADVEVQKHNYAGAVLLYQQALDHFKGVLPRDHLQVGSAEVRLGDALFRERQFTEAEPHLSTGRSILIKKGGDPGNWTQLAEADLAAIHKFQNAGKHE